MLNPGWGPHDYFSEYKNPEYRKALIENIQQKGTNPFLFLDPRFSWHGGYTYWHAKLHQLIATFAHETCIHYSLAREFFQKEIAVVELVPYRSVSSSVSSAVVKKLQSGILAREFIIKRALTTDCLVVATRAVKNWDLPNQDNVICFDSKQARSAHLTAKSREIVTFLKRRFVSAR
jgi:hypothetical protein